MTSSKRRQHWRRVEEVFLQALELDPREQEGFLDQVCESQELRAEVSRMLAADRQAEVFLERPAAELPTLSAVWAQPESLPVDEPQAEGRLVGRLLAERFRVLRFLAAGGMGEVYEAEDLELEERVAIKTIRPELAADPAAMDRFRREVQLARRVTHPGVCRIFDLFRHPAAGPAESSGSEDSLVFLSMELLRGETLADRLRGSGPMKPEVALELARQMAAALEAAHERGIVHRDLKSANVFLVPEASGQRVVITDFGLARPSAEGDSPDLRVTGSGMVLGTPAYMAPEQMKGEEPTPATDLYAFGILLYEILTGCLPFGDDHAMAIALRRLEEPPTPPSQQVEGLDPSWDRAILGCLAVRPEHRLQSAAQVLECFEGAPLPPQRIARSRRVGALGGAVGLLALVLSVWGWWALEQRSSRDLDRVSVGAVVEKGALAPARKSLAVLAFHDLVGTEDSAWLSTALSELLTMELGVGDQVRTVSGENVSRMQLELALPETGSLAPETVQRVRRHLGCDLVVTGTYFAGDNGIVRVDLRLEDAAAGTTLTLLSEEGQIRELPRLVSAMGRRLRVGMGLEALSAGEGETLHSTVPRSPEVARLYAEGLARWRLFDAAGARDAFLDAVEIDPKSPRIFAALADAYSALGYDSEAVTAGRRAFDLADRLPRLDRLRVEGQLRQANREWERAAEIYHTLRELYPDDLEPGLRLAEVQVASGRGEDALETLEQLRATVDPGARDARIDLAMALAAESISEYVRSVRAARRAAERAELVGARWLLANARFREARALWRQGELAPATEAVSLAEAAFREIGDRAGRADALNLLANLAENRGELDAAEETYLEALELHRTIGHQNGVTRVLDNLGILALRRDRLAAAVELHEEALEIARELGDSEAVARSLNNLARVRRRQGDSTAAQDLFEQALALAREIGDRTLQSSCLNSLGIILRRRGNLEGALRYYQESLTLALEVGNPRDIAGRLNNLGLLYRQRGDLEAARGQYRQALAIYKEIDDRRREGRTLNNLAALFRKAAELEAAAELYQEVAKIHQEIDDPAGRATFHNGLGLLETLRGDLESARAHLEAGIELRLELGQEDRARAARIDLARVDLAAGRVAEAISGARQAAVALARAGRDDDELAAWTVVVEALLEAGDSGELQEPLVRGQELSANRGDRESRWAFAIAEGRARAATGRLSAGLELLTRVEKEAGAAGLRVLALRASLARARLELEAEPSPPAEERLRDLENEAAELGLAGLL